MVQGIGNGNNAVMTGNANGIPASDRNESGEAASLPKFADVYKQFQAKYGEKAQKPREIKKNLGKDDFLNIMITQMKNQDPTNPFKAEQMAAEMAQFASLEQLQNINTNINKMGDKNKPIERMSMTNLIGKTVTIDKQKFPHSEGENDYLTFNLPRGAASVKVSILDPSGEEVIEKDLGSQDAGEVSFSWDGIKKNTLPAKSGEFFVKVHAKDEKGRTIETESKATSRVIGISFEGNEPIFLIGDAKHQEKVTMQNIIRIDESDASANSPARPSNSTSGVRPNLTNNGASLPPSMKAMMANAPTLAPSVPNTGAVQNFNGEKGFPNGLQEQNDLRGGDRR
jgi:flagellar basal-body rod modification protein FlgD